MWFERFLAAAGRSPRTRRLYVGAAGRWLESGGVPGHLDAECLSRFLGTRRRTVGAASLRMDAKAIRSFYRAMHALGHAADGQAQRVPQQRRGGTRMVRWFVVDEVRALLAAPDLTTWVGMRDYVLMRTLYETGLRSNEIARLAIGEVLPDNTLFVRAGKGGRDRYVPITAGLRELLDAWVAGRRREVRPGKRAELFVTHRGRPFRDGRGVWEIVSGHARRALGAACGFDRVRRALRGTPWQGQYPHLLRASIATHLNANGMPLPAVADMLGHASIATTGHYVGGDLELLRRALAKHPRARLRAVPAEDADAAPPIPAT